jgi:hypothetical protein
MAFWVPLAVMAGSTLAGMAMGKEKQRQQQKAMDMQVKMRAAEQRNAPWTGRTSFTEITPAGSQAGEMMGGGLAGLQTGSSMYSGLSGAFQADNSFPEVEGKNLEATGGDPYEQQIGKSVNPMKNYLQNKNFGFGGMSNA